MYLNTHSYYSLRYGTLSIDELLDLAIQNGMETIALTDINTTMGIPELVNKAQQKGIRPVAGCEFRKDDELLYIGLAKNREGLKELNDWQTEHNLEKKPYPPDAPEFQEVFVVYPFGKKSSGELRENESTGIRAEDLNKLLTSEYRKHLDKLVVLQPVTFKDRAGWFLHKTLRAIDHNVLISKLQENQFANPLETMDFRSLKQQFERFPEIIKNTKRLLETCSISFDFTTSKNKKVFGQSAYDDKLLLRKLALDGMLYRYGKNNPEAK
ncbi:MAG: PHP domain-containing protein, partial [Bacteroidia bacterium]